ncbi:hypothetical protein [Paraburkholderia sabiae]|uniref:hypothetical protein n=1 Tax=Paraburkholderia sabiae TaxID=273251 RepID=UPI001CC71360|nr:hypothetical protein [Paraburkholderia sabiae]
MRTLRRFVRRRMPLAFDVSRAAHSMPLCESDCLACEAWAAGSAYFASVVVAFAAALLVAFAA